MTKISGWIFMAIGAVMALFSKYVQKKGGEGMSLFFWVGIIMIGIGIFKIVIFFVFREKKKNEERPADSTTQRTTLQKLGLNKALEVADGDRLNMEKEKAMKKVRENSILICAMCGTKHYSNSNFCHLCGSKLK